MFWGFVSDAKEEIADVLSVTLRTATAYLQDIEEQLKAEREETMLSMWLACHDQREIAEAVGVTSETVSTFLQNIQKTETLPKSDFSAISHDTDFSPQIYSVWNFPKATNAVRHFGNIPPCCRISPLTRLSASLRHP